MSHLPIVTDEEADPEQAVLFEHCEKMLGRVANAMRVAAHAPKIAQPLLGFMIPDASRRDHQRGGRQHQDNGYPENVDAQWL